MKYFPLISLKNLNKLETKINYRKKVLQTVYFGNEIEGKPKTAIFIKYILVHFDSGNLDACLVEAD